MGNNIPVLSEKRKKEISDRLYHNIFFNKKFREGIKKDFSEMMDRGVKLMDSLPNPHTIKEAKDRLLGESMIDLGNLYVKKVEEAEKKQARMNQYGKFVLYRKDKTYVYYIKTIRRGKMRFGYLLFTDGLNGKGKKGIYREFGKFNVKGYEKIDWGKMHLKQTDFTKGYYHFWGKYAKSFYNFDITSWNKRRMYFKVVKAA